MSRKNIVVLDGYTANPGDISWDAFEMLGNVTVYDRSPKKEEVIERSKDADIVLTNKAIISREVMEKCPRLKYVGVTATGYNVVDMPAAAELGVTITNVPAYSTSDVAQTVFSLLLDITNRSALHNDAVKSGEWAACVDFTFWKTRLISLSGKTFGIIGYGQIGAAVAKIANAFGMNVLVNTRTPSKVQDPNVSVVPLETVYQESDIISLHCPLTDVNRGMINKNAISQMKDGVIIINTARGPLINEADLAEALKSGKVYAAGCDVASVEPINADNPLLLCDNCIMTPHIAWATVEARTRLLQIAADNVRSYLDGNPQNVVV